jgi:hypothetical protein
VYHNPSFLALWLFEICPDGATALRQDRETTMENRRSKDRNLR